jgi:hypothetical protein
MTIAVVQTAPPFCSCLFLFISSSLFFRVSVPLFHGCCYLVRPEISVILLLAIFSILYGLT